MLKTTATRTATRTRPGRTPRRQRGDGGDKRAMEVTWAERGHKRGHGRDTGIKPGHPPGRNGGQQEEQDMRPAQTPVPPEQCAQLRTRVTHGRKREHDFRIGRIHRGRTSNNVHAEGCCSLSTWPQSGLPQCCCSTARSAVSSEPVVHSRLRCRCWRIQGGQSGCVLSS